MDTGNENRSYHPETPRAEIGDAQRPIYVLRYEEGAIEGSVVRLSEIFRILWSGKWIILGMSASVAIATAVYSLNVTEWYRADTLLALAGERATPPAGGQLGGLAALAGVSVGGDTGAEAIAVLESRELLRNFIVSESVLVHLAPHMGAQHELQSLQSDELDAADLREAVDILKREVVSVRQERDTGLVTLSVQWTDPTVAAEWANALVRHINSRMRQRSLQEAEANVEYLQREIQSTTVLPLQQSIGRLLENELQKLMLARGTEEFSFRVLDAAEPPRMRYRPRRTLMVLVASVAGIVLSSFLVLLLHAVRK